MLWRVFGGAFSAVERLERILLWIGAKQESFYEINRSDIHKNKHGRWTEKTNLFTCSYFYTRNVLDIYSIEFMARID